MALPFMRENRASYGYLLRWVVTATIAGLVAAATVHGVQLAIELVLLQPGYRTVPAPVWAVVAALLSGAFLFRVAPDAAGEGMPSYIEALERRLARFPRRATAWKLPATVVAILGFGCGGMVGPVGRAVSGAMAAPFGRDTGSEVTNAQRRTAAICGMAATVAAFFHSPIGAGIFAVEVIQRANMRYRDLFPAILAGSIAAGFSRARGWRALIEVEPFDGPWVPERVPALLLLAIVVAFASGLFVRGYAATVRLYARDRRPAGPVTLIGMIVAVGLTSAINPGLLGTAPVLSAIPSGPSWEAIGGHLPHTWPILPVLVIALVVRAWSAFATVGSGMSAGLTAPAFQVGLLLGAIAWQAFAPELPAAQALPFLAIGFSGMLAGAMNVPIAAAVMGIEIFGPGVGMPVAIVSVVAFQVNRHRTIYDYALAGGGHGEEDDR